MPDSQIADIVVRLREVENRLAVLQNDSQHSVHYIDKLDQTMAKLTEVSSNLSRIIAVQEQRLSEIEKINTEIRDSVKAVDEKVSGKIDDEKLKEVKDKIGRIEKIMYISWGGLSVIIFITVNFGKDLIKIIPGVG